MRSFERALFRRTSTPKTGLRATRWPSSGVWCASSVMLLAILAASPATAEETGSGRPDVGAAGEADRLFREGRQLLEAGQPAQACVVLARSQELEAASGTLLNLGLCHRRCNRLASAWRSYAAAERLARERGDAQRVELARMEASELERLLGRVIIEVGPDPEPGLRLFVDGLPLAREDWGGALPVDSGAHLLRAEAPGYRPWQVEIGNTNGARLAIRVPSLDPEPPAPARASPSGAPLPVRKTALGAAPPPLGVTSGKERLTPRQDAALYGLGGVGIVALAASGYFVLDAVDKKSDGNGECRASDICTSRGVALRDDARESAAYATALGVLGVGALAGAGVLWLSGPPRHEAPEAHTPRAVSLSIEPARLGVRIGGEF